MANEPTSQPPHFGDNLRAELARQKIDHNEFIKREQIACGRDRFYRILKTGDATLSFVEACAGELGVPFCSLYDTTN